MALIGVIIPVYNVERYIHQCIESVINQSFKDIEIILVNDGSTDNSGKICDDYAKKDSRINVIHKENGGLSDARNAGIKNATAKYLLFLDSDDYWMDDSLIEISEYAKSDIDIVFLTSTKLFEKENKIEKEFEMLDEESIKNKSQEEVFRYLSKVDKFPVSACTKLIKRELILKENLYFEKGLLSEDIDWSTKLLLKASKYDVCNTNFYVYRKQRSESITDSVKLKNVKDLLYIINKWVNKCDNKEVDKVLINPLLGLYAYEYTILMGHIYSINKHERSQIIDDIKCLKRILHYSTSKKTKLVRNVCNLIGFNNTAYLLNAYIKYKN